MTRAYRAGLSLAGCLCSVACAPIKTEVRFVDGPAETRRIERVIDGSRTFAATARIEGVRLVIALTSEETCEVADVPVVRRKRVTTHTEAQSGFILAEYAIGAGGILLGGLALQDPQRACSTTRQGGDPREPEDCAAAGWSLVALGAAALGLAVIDTVRTADFEEDLGEQEGPHQTTRQPCHAGPVRSRAIELSIGDTALRGTTSTTGEVAFSMLDAGEEELPSPSRPGVVQLDGAPVTVALTEQQHRDLAVHLLDDPRSRIARDFAETEQRRCEQAVTAAESHAIRPDTDDATIAEVELRWEHAKRRCGARWTAAHAAKRDAVHDALLTNRVSAMTLALASGDLDRTEELIAGHPAAARRLREDAATLQLLRKLIGAPTRDIASQRGPSGAAHHRLCRARQVFVAIRGQLSWDQIKHEIAKNASELEGGDPVNLARIMDAARCQ